MNTKKNKGHVAKSLDKIKTELSDQEEKLRSILKQNIYKKDAKEFLETAIDNLEDAQFNIRHIFESENK